MVDFYSGWPILGCFAIVFLVAASPLFRAADSPAGTQTRRLLTMDGARGILALSVVFHHAAIYHRFVTDGRWMTPPVRLFAIIGPIAVGLFFMITGFLFWSQLIRTKGRPDWKALYIGRVFRIGPLYLFAVLCMMAAVAAKTGFHLHQPPLKVLKQCVAWMSLGLLNGSGVLNGYLFPGSFLAGVTWTLQWEWFFYLSMPILALFARRKGIHLWFVLTGLVLMQVGLHASRNGWATGVFSLVTLFLLGMLVASLRENGSLFQVPPVPGSVLMIGLLTFAFQFENPTLSTSAQFALGLVFYLVVTGSTVFGLLTSRAAVRLGDVSYGIYLLQGLALAAVFRLPFCRVLAAKSSGGYWALVLLSELLLIALATWTHRWIERPGILLGKRIAG